jgi:urease accessory protein
VKAAALTRLLQLGSQALPIGGYSHSQGLESAIERRMVTDEASVLRWISSVLQFSMYTFEVPSLLALSDAWVARDDASLTSLNEEFIATRESAELRAATVQMGFSMRALLYVLPDLPTGIMATLRSMHEPSLPCVWSAATTAWAIDSRDSTIAYVWAWAENQVLAAVKTLPMGQSAGQRLLLTLGQSIALNLEDIQIMNGDDRSNFAPALAILCAQHETQYSRLFRS